MNTNLYLNVDFVRFEILKEAKSLSKNELKELGYRERKVLNVVIKNQHFKEKKYEVSLKNHLDELIEHKPIERSKISRVFFEVKDKLFKLATGDQYRKLHPGLQFIQRRYNEDTVIEKALSFASDIIGKPQDHLSIEKAGDDFLISDYDTKRPLLKVKITPYKTALEEANSPSFFKAGKIPKSNNVLIAY